MQDTTRLFLSEVLAGLSASPKTLPCKYFYDARGSELFEAICELDEYYLTRADFEATARNIGAIESALADGGPFRLVELGSGSSSKTRLLLDAISAITSYTPIDISESALEQSVASLHASYPALPVVPLCADYSQRIELPTSDVTRTVIYFPGSTIGNFHPAAASAFLRRVHAAIAPGGGALIGVDLKKDKATLERAYDDAAGVTAAFNFNLLTRINRELEANFDLSSFRHMARYDESLGRIEMHLLSTSDQSVRIGDHEVRLAAGESIRTEESYKYSQTDIERVAREAGLTVAQVWTDAEARFSLQWLLPTLT